MTNQARRGSPRGCPQQYNTKTVFRGRPQGSPLQPRARQTSASSVEPLSSPAARILFFGGRIYTLDDRLPLCDAMIVHGDRISWLGKASELSSVPSDRYEIIDLDGKIVLPGFIDSHTHLVFWALSRQRIDLDGATSYENALQRIRAFVAKLSKKDKLWVIGKGWKKEQWRRVRWPHRSDLDKIISDRPAVIFSKDEHSVWVNSCALEVAGIDRKTPDPDGGRIDRDEKGDLAGILHDRAMYLIYDLYRPPAGRGMRRVMEDGFQEMYRQGCIGVASFDYPHEFETLIDLDVAGKLPVKVAHYFRVELLDDAIRLKMRAGFGSEFLKVLGAKIFVDGALGSQTALMLRPFEGMKDNCGICETPPKELVRLICLATKAGLTCAIHAIGDLANRHALDAIASARRDVLRRFRHRIEHCQIVSPDDIKRFKQLNVIASMQPSHATADIDLMKKYLGKRQKDSYRMRTLSRLGVTQCFGSDAPIEPLNPLQGIYAAVSGRRPGSRLCFNPRETLTVQQAVRGFTLGGAEAVGEARIRGSLAIGKKADFILLDRDIMRLAPESLLKTKVVATYINGELKYSRDGFPR